MAEKSVKLTSVYSCQSIDVCSELYYICELGKYLSRAGYALSLDGVSLDDRLSKSRYWNYFKIAVANGWVVDVGVSPMKLKLDRLNLPNLSKGDKQVRNILITEGDIQPSSEERLRRSEDVYYNLVTPTIVTQIFNKTQDHWSWSYAEQGSHRAELYAPMAHNLVSICAYVAIHRLLTGTPKTFTMDLTSVMFTASFALVDLDILQNETNAFVTSSGVGLSGDSQRWFTYETDMSEAQEVRRGYEAWYYIGEERGFLKSNGGLFSMEEKYNNFCELGLKVGSVVGLYTRDEAQESNLVKDIKDWFPCVVRKITKRSITVEKICTIKTPYTTKREYNSLSDKVKTVYGAGGVNTSLTSRTETYGWESVGVEYCMWDELKFFTPIPNNLADTGLIEFDENTALMLSPADFIYSIFKIYNVDFDEEEFKRFYFPHTKPVFDLWMAEQGMQ